jgi:uncharacterized protein (DUF58 family)|tara:strand:- start:5139 stop:6110 length:972 start_codon:yes stop_codon:yes gene_type:complete
MPSRTISSQHKPGGGAYTSLRALTRLRYAAKEIDLVAISRAINPLSGLLRSNFHGRGIDFAEVRIYQPGDDVRTIDWRVTARTQKPHTKLFQEEKERPVLLIVDQSSSMFFGSRVTFKSVLAAQSAALIAWTALEGGDRVGGLVFSDSEHREVRPRRSKHSVLRLMHEIDAYNHRLGNERRPAGNYSFTDALRAVRRVTKHGGVIFIISDFQQFDTEAKLHLRQLARHNDIVGMHISDEMERSLPAPDLYTITDGMDRTRINTADPAHRTTYREDFRQRAALVGDEFKKNNAPFFELQTHEPVIDSIANKYSQYAHSKRQSVH